MSQTTVKGTVSADGMPLSLANVMIKTLKKSTVSDSEGNFKLHNISKGNYEIHVSYTGFKSQTQNIIVSDSTEVFLNFDLKENNTLDEVVITGTLKPVSRIESPVPVEVYKPIFFKKNPTANIFEALQNVNGVRPQLNCNVCNTGDIHYIFR